MSGALRHALALLACLCGSCLVSAHYHPPASEVLTSHPAPTSSLHHVRGPHHPRGSSRQHEHYTPQRSAPGQDTKLTQDKQLLRDEEHIREDLGSWISKEDTKKMTGEELEFHYFKLHDFDNNTKLDGLEILQAIQHIVHDSKDDPDSEAASTRSPADDFNYYIELIDKVLVEDDLDNDGYLSYIEYVLGRQKDDHELQQQETAAAAAITH